MTSVKIYLDNFPESSKLKFLNIFNQFKDSIPDHAEVIKYGLPTLIKNGKNIIHIGIFKNHIGLYPGPRAIIHLNSDLSKFKVSKGTIQISFNQEIPKELIKKIAAYNIEYL